MATILVAMGMAGIAWAFPETVHAAEGIRIPEGIDLSIAQVVSIMITILHLLTWIVFVFLNTLLDPRFIFDLSSSGQEGALMDMLNEIWQLARDLMNIIFAFVLIGAAIYTIITTNKEFLSTHAPKFVMAVILVNFSWFFPRVIIDVANVATTAVYGIPSYLQQPGFECRVARNKPGPVVEDCKEEGPNQYSCPCQMIVDVQFFLKTPADLVSLKNQSYQCPLGQILCYKEEKLDVNAIEGYSAVLNGLIINYSRLGSLGEVPKAEPGGMKLNDFIVFLVREVLVLIIHIALFFPLLAMLVAFVMRIPVLWVTIAFMPFIFLDYVGGDQLNMGEDIPKKIWKTFLKAAFLPAMVAVPLSVGFLLLNAGTGVQFQGGDLGIELRIWDGITNYYQLLWLGLSLGILWMGVFMVLKGDDVLSTGAQAIKSAGEGYGKFALKAPLALPIIPGMPGATPLSLSKGLNSNNLNAALYAPGGLKAVIDNLKDNKKTGRPGETAGAVKTLGADDEKSKKLRIKIDTQIGNGANANFEQLKTTLKELGYTNVEDKEIYDRLTEIDTKLRAEGKQGITGLTNEDVKKKFKEAQDTRNKPKP